MNNVRTGIERAWEHIKLVKIENRMVLYQAVVREGHQNYSVENIEYRHNVMITTTCTFT